jgi:hypothetical protein
MLLVGLDVDDPVWDHSPCSKNRDRLLTGDIAAGGSMLTDQPHPSVSNHPTEEFVNDLGDEAVLEPERTASSTAC